MRASPKHLFEDLLIVEMVDERNRPVPPGEVAAKLLVTVLFSRTQPLIRYEMSDTISLSNLRCECGRELGLVDQVEGRREEVIVLPQPAGTTVSIHPNVFHHILEPLPVKQWQIEQTEARLSCASSRAGAVVPGTIAAASRARFRSRRPARADRVQFVDAVAKTPLGKSPLIKAPSPRRGSPVAV